MNTRPATLISFLNDLRQASIDFRLNQVRDDAIMVEVAVPGERWEIEFFENGNVEVEVFRSDGQIHDVSILDGLFSCHSG